MARPTDDPKTFRLDLRFPPHLVEGVDEWRRNQPDIPPRAEAIRRLVAMGLQYGVALENIDGLLEILDRHKVSSEEMERVVVLGQKLGAAEIKAFLDARVQDDDAPVEKGSP